MDRDPRNLKPLGTTEPQRKRTHKKHRSIKSVVAEHKRFAKSDRREGHRPGRKCELLDLSGITPLAGP
jgi:hypothetical protein